MEVPEIEVDVPFVPYVPTFEDLQARVTAALRSVEDVYPDGAMLIMGLPKANCKWLGV